MWFILACVVAVIAFLFWMEMPKESDTPSRQPQQVRMEPPNYREPDPRFAFVHSCCSCKYGGYHPAGYCCQKYGVVMRGDGAGFEHICDDFEDDGVVFGP